MASCSTQPGMVARSTVARASAGSAAAEVRIDDIVAADSDDPQGLVLGAVLLPLTICSVIIAAVVALLLEMGPARRMLDALVVVSAGSGLARHVGQWLPPGAGNSLVRSSVYFNGNEAGQHIAVLIAWTGFGFVAIFLGHHRFVGFAAARHMAATVTQSTARDASSPLNSPAPVTAAPAGSTLDAGEDDAGHDE